MLSSNKARLTIVMGMKDKTNYSEFEELCNARNVVPLTKFEYAQKIGILLCAIYEYPNTPIADAYVKFIDESQKNFTDQTISSDATRSQILSTCGSCGGGRVR